MARFRAVRLFCELGVCSVTIPTSSPWRNSHCLMEDKLSHSAVLGLAKPTLILEQASVLPGHCVGLGQGKGHATLSLH